VVEVVELLADGLDAIDRLARGQQLGAQMESLLVTGVQKQPRTLRAVVLHDDKATGDGPALAGFPDCPVQAAMLPSVFRVSGWLGPRTRSRSRRGLTAFVSSCACGSVGWSGCVWLYAMIAWAAFLYLYFFALGSLRRSSVALARARAVRRVIHTHAATNMTKAMIRSAGTASILGRGLCDHSARKERPARSRSGRRPRLRLYSLTPKLRRPSARLCPVASLGSRASTCFARSTCTWCWRWRYRS